MWGRVRVRARVTVTVRVRVRVRVRQDARTQLASEVGAEYSGGSAPPPRCQLAEREHVEVQEGAAFIGLGLG